MANFKLDNRFVENALYATGSEIGVVVETIAEKIGVSSVTSLGDIKPNVEKLELRLRHLAIRTHQTQSWNIHYPAIPDLDGYGRIISIPFGSDRPVLILISKSTEGRNDPSVLDHMKAIVSEISADFDETVSPLQLYIDPGSAPKEEIAELLSEVSKLYRMVGGSGITFSVSEVRCHEEVML